ncbi:hypothetical protein NC652_008499 [Populus alba x Populus x berolinensis]|nr:hypothetical protein NC652_008499 [Populus alba x Populus x berolinensis]
MLKKGLTAELKKEKYFYVDLYVCGKKANEHFLWSKEVLETVGAYNIYGDGGNTKRKAIFQLHLQTTLMASRVSSL